MTKAKKQQFVIHGYGGTGGWDSWKPKLPDEVRELIYKAALKYANLKQRYFVMRQEKKKIPESCEWLLYEFRRQIMKIILLERQYNAYDFCHLELEKEIMARCITLMKFAKTKFEQLEKRSTRISTKTVNRYKDSFLNIFSKTDANVFSKLKRNDKYRPLVVV